MNRREQREQRKAEGRRRCSPAAVGLDASFSVSSVSCLISSARSNEKERKMAESSRSAKSTTKKAAKKSAKSTTAIKGFTDEERVAMKERVQELKEAARRGPRANKADGESAVLAKIAAMPEPDRALGERLHAIIKASAPALSPKTWYGMPAYAKDGKVVCFFQSAQ